MVSPGHSIAIVDDEEPVRRALSRLLRIAGFDVECFASGADFLASLSLRRPECVILDLHMPAMDGWTVLERISGHRLLRVIVITGRETSGNRLRAMEAGAAAFLPKPVDKDLLLASILAPTNDP